MKFETTAKLLTAALRNLTPVIERRNTIPILSCVLFEGRTIRGTDLDIDLFVSVPASTASGKIAIDHRALLNLVRHIPADDTVRIEGGSEGATVTFPSGRYDLPSLPASDYPDLLTAEFKPVDVDGEALKKALAFVSPFISTEETRYYLNGVCLDGRVAVATDGHRLTCHPTGTDLPAFFERPIIPRKVVALMRGLPAAKSVRIATDRPAMVADFDGARLVSKLIDGTFPDWRRVVPKDTDKNVTLTVDRLELSKAMKRIAATTPGGKPYVALAFDEQRLVVSGSRHGEVTAREYINNVGISGDGQVVGLQAKYLHDVLTSFREDETVRLAIVDGGSPIIVRGKDEDIFTVLMPARIGDEKLALETLHQWAAAQDVGRAA